MSKIEWTDETWERFLAEVPTEEGLAGKSDGVCWEWQAGLFSNGYGQFRVGRRKVRAHRAMFEAIHGPIPEGMIVCHRCDNPRCVRPTHLFLGTHADNARDRDRKGRGTRGRKRPEAGSPGERNPSARLTEDDVHRIRVRRELGDTYSELAECFGVAKSTIAAVCRRDTWSHLA